MVQGKFQGKQPPPYFIYMLSVPWRCWGIYYAQTSKKMLHPTVYKPATTSWTIQSKCLFLLGKVSAIIRKEKTDKSKLNLWIQNNSWRGMFPSPNYFFFFFFYKWISSEAIWQFLVWNIISSSLCRTPLSPWCIFLTEPSLSGLLYHKSHHIIFDNLY